MTTPKRLSAAWRSRHPEGIPLAVANIYCDLADAIRGADARRPADLPRPSGLRSMAAVHAAVASAKAGGTWMDARPPMFR